MEPTRSLNSLDPAMDARSSASTVFTWARYPLAIAEETARRAQDALVRQQQLERDLLEARTELAALHQLLVEIPQIFERKFQDRIAGNPNPRIDEAGASRPHPPSPSGPPGPPGSSGAGGVLSPAAAGSSSSLQPIPWLRAALSLLLVAGAGGSVVLAARHGLPRWMTLRPAPPAVQPSTGPSRPASAAAPQNPASPPPSDSLTLTPRGISWVEVSTPGGRILFRDMLKVPRTFRLNGGLRVMAGRPDLVDVRLAGRPSRVLGTIDQVRWHRFPGPEC